MRHNFVICLWEPHLHKHYQADVQAVSASQNTLEGSPPDLVVALTWQGLVMSDMTLAVEEILQRLYRLDQHGHHDDTILQWECQHYTAALLWDYASPKTTNYLPCLV